jgi:hypothetical protein
MRQPTRIFGRSVSTTISGISSGDQEYYELPVVAREVRVRVNAAHTLRQCIGVVFSKLFAAVVAVWGLAIAVITYVLKLDAVKGWISNLIKPFLSTN